jgi:hypothetical protein
MVLIGPVPPYDRIGKIYSFVCNLKYDVNIERVHDVDGAIPWAGKVYYNI